MNVNAETLQHGTNMVMKLIGWCFMLQKDNESKHSVKITQDTEDKTEGRENHKQAATEGGCSKVRAKHVRGGNLMS